MSRSIPARQLKTSMTAASRRREVDPRRQRVLVRGHRGDTGRAMDRCQGGTPRPDQGERGLLGPGPPEHLRHRRCGGDGGPGSASRCQPSRRLRNNRVAMWPTSFGHASRHAPCRDRSAIRITGGCRARPLGRCRGFWLAASQGRSRSWVIWSAVHLFLLLGARNKMVVYLNWVWAWLTYGSGARLMTASTGPSQRSTSGTDGSSPQRQKLNRASVGGRCDQ